MRRNLLDVGVVYKDWLDKPEHRLVLDLTGFDFLVDDGSGLVPLDVYLEEHPERTGEVRDVIRQKMQ